MSAIEARSQYRLLRYPVTVATALPADQVFEGLRGLRLRQRGEVWLLSFADDGHGAESFATPEP